MDQAIFWIKIVLGFYFIILSLWFKVKNIQSFLLFKATMFGGGIFIIIDAFHQANFFTITLN